MRSGILLEDRNGGQSPHLGSVAVAGERRIRGGKLRPQQLTK